MGVPYREHPGFVLNRRVVNVVARASEQQATHAAHRRTGDTNDQSVVRLKGVRRIRSTRPGTSPAQRGDCLATNFRFRGLCLRFRSESNRKAHRRLRNSSKTSEAGRRRPASADFQDAESASWRARRSSSVRSSPSSSATRSITVPSGKVVGSSSTIRPLRTCALSGLISPLYGLPQSLATVKQTVKEVFRWNRRGG